MPEASITASALKVCSPCGVPLQKKLEELWVGLGDFARPSEIFGQVVTWHVVLSKVNQWAVGAQAATVAAEGCRGSMGRRSQPFISWLISSGP
jgi:hypothetical protein